MELDLIAGQFIPDPSAPTTGTQRLFNSISAQVYFLPPSSPLANDYTPPTIGSSQATLHPTAPRALSYRSPRLARPSSRSWSCTPTLAPRALGPAKRWTSSNGLTWTGTGSAATTNGAQYIVEAVNGALYAGRFQQ